MAKMVHICVVTLSIVPATLLAEGLPFKKDGRRLDVPVVVLKLTSEQKALLERTERVQLTRVQKLAIRRENIDTSFFLTIYPTGRFKNDCSCGLYNFGHRFSSDSVEVPTGYLLSDAETHTRDSIVAYWKNHVPSLEEANAPDISSKRWFLESNLLEDGIATIDSSSLSHLKQIVQSEQGRLVNVPITSPLLDRNLKTAVVLSPRVENDTLSFRFTIQGNEQFQFIGVRIANGHQGSWEDYARFRRAVVHTYYGHRFLINLRDQPGYQYFPLPGMFLLGDDEMSFRIDFLDVHGQSWTNDAAISEIEILGLHYISPEKRK